VFVQPLLQWKSNKHYIFLVCVCNFRYPPCNANAPYCHLWPASPYNIFPLFLKKRYDFRGKKVIERKMCVVIFSTNLSEIFLFLRRNERNMIKIYVGHNVKCRYSCELLMKLEFSRQIFGKIFKYQISWKSFQWEPSCSIRTDGRTEVTNLIVAFRNFAKAPKNPSICSELKMWITAKGDRWTLLYAPWHEAILYLLQENLYRPAAASRSSSNLMFRGPNTFPSSGLWIRNPGDKGGVSF